MTKKNMTVINQMKGYTPKEKACFNLGWRAAMDLVEALNSPCNNTIGIIQKISTIINGRGDNLTKVLKCKDILARR